MQSILSLIEAKAYKKAHALCIKMIENNIQDPRPYCGLAHIAFDHKNVPKALELFQTAQKYSPQDPFYIAQYAKALTLIGRQAAAREQADRAADLPINDAMTADMIGVIYSRTGFHEKAIPFFKQAVSLNPQPANFHYNLASSLQFSGDFDAAETHYNTALARDPDLFRARASLVSLKKQTAGQNQLENLKSEYKRLSGNSDAVLTLGHAIAKTLEDLGDHRESLDWLIKCKAPKRAELDYHISQDIELIEAARTALNTKADMGLKSEDAPIFIVGLPRTGTTLIDRILSSHPDVIAAGELNVFSELTKHLASTPSQYVLDKDTLEAASNKSVTQIGHDYIRATKELSRGAERFTDKMPLNFLNCGLIHRALPNARIVALRRGAMDSCLSNFRQLFATKYSYYNYTFDLQDTAKYYKAYDALMTTWRESLPANRFMEIRYENMIDHQDRETRRLLEFCGLDWDEACLRFHENKAPVSTASSVQVRQPLYRGSVGRWKKYGEKLNPLKNALGTLAET
ncbi:tetratricopeptide repeat-containing sulfotransferase family protein [Hellea balneolensis]|uniref:tetratricopeptide repeat-containing sulfotransferase family protein n=1 Tax=Hellea balneolensis TaxID=287478 RepID=UPI0003FA8CB2|nr:sulfotransferase [Hellea balneolensis]